MFAVCHKVRDESCFVNHASKKRSILIQSKNSIIGEVSSDYEDRLSRNSSLVDLFTSCHLIDVDESKFGDDVQKTVLLCDHQGDREVVRSRRVIDDFSVLLELLNSFGRSRNLSDVNQRFSLSSLSFDEAKNVGSVSIVMKKHFTEGAGMAFEHLLLATLNQVELNVAIDSLSAIRSRNCEEGCPFAIGTKDISNYLPFFQVSRSIKDLNFLFFRFGDANVID